MYDYVITCLTCGAERDHGGLDTLPDLSDADVLTLAGHSPDCLVGIADPKTGTVTHYQRTGEPNTVLYEIAEAV